MGCGGSKRQPSANNDDPIIADIKVPDIDPRYPAPAPPKSNKNDIYDQADYDKLDAQVKQQMNRLNPSTYENLVAALNAICSTDLQKLRAIFVWLFHQNIYGNFYSGVTDPYTPRGYMKLMKTGNGSYASFFAQLCRAAGLPCNVIRGFGRGDSYVVGQPDVTDLESAWCAVYVKGDWRLIHPLWAYFHEKQVYANGIRPKPGTKRTSINEFFYLIDPNKMIVFCLPNASPWQLLKTKWDLGKFCKSPLFTEEYFFSSLMLPKKYNAVIPAENGICLIDFDHDEHVEPTLEAKAHPQDHTVGSKNTTNRRNERKDGIKTSRTNTSSPVKTQTGENHHITDTQMSNYVVTSSSYSRKTVVVKFPASGDYKLEVYGGTSAAKPKIVEFLLDCKDASKSNQHFPLLPMNGFGLLYGPAATLGISDLNPDSGIVIVKSAEEKTFTFTTTQPLELKAELSHNTATDLENCVNCRSSDHSGQVKVNVPKEKIIEFGLQISAKTANSTRPFTLVANFLLVDENWRKKTAVVSPRRATNADAIRQELISATQASDIVRLEKAVTEFTQHGLQDNGDLTRALDRLVALHLENLHRTTEERKLEPLDEAIESAKRSHVAKELLYTKEMEEAEATRRQLRRLKLYMHKVLTLNKATISEIHRYHRPRPLVHSVMKATFRVLGEPQSKIKEWSYIQTCMRQLGPNNMMARVRRFDPVSMKPGQVRDAQSYLDQTNKYLVRLCSAGAGTFYIWSNNMIVESEGKGQIDPLEIWQSKPRLHSITTKMNRGPSNWGSQSPYKKEAASSRAGGSKNNSSSRGDFVGNQTDSSPEAYNSRQGVHDRYSRAISPVDEDDASNDYAWDSNQARKTGINNADRNDAWSDDWNPNTYPSSNRANVQHG